MTKGLVAAVAAGWTVLAGAAELRLMFGSEKATAPQRAFAGFRFVSDRDPMCTPGKGGKGRYTGWAATPGPGYTHADMNKGSLPADTLLDHGVVATRKAELKVPFADGPCVVHVWIGDFFRGWNRLLLLDRDADISLVCGGRTVYSDTMTVESVFREWCRFGDYVFSRRDSQWDRIVKPILREFTFDAVAENGVVTLEMNQILLTALAVTSTRPEMEELLADVEAQRRAEFARRYPWKPQPDEPMPAGVSDAGGFLFFAKGGYDDVFPWTRPLASEVRDEIRAFAARGEQEFLRFGVLPVRDLGRLEIRVGEFRRTDGTALATDWIEVWRERYMERGCQLQTGVIDNLRLLDPLSNVFQPNAPQPAEAGTPRMYTVDVAVAATAKPGDYLAPVDVVLDGKVARTAKLRLKVLPFALRTEDAADYGFQMQYYTWPYRVPGDNTEAVYACIERRARFIEKYGFSNFFVPPHFAWGKVTGEPGESVFTQNEREAETMRREMAAIDPGKRLKFFWLRAGQMLRKCGWKGIQPQNDARSDRTWTKERAELWEKSLRDIERMVPQVQAACERNGLPQVWWYFQGELDNFGERGVREYVRLGELLKRLGVVSHTVINGPWAAKLTPPVYDHIWANPHTPVSEDLKARIESYGHRMGAHNSGDTRFQAGLQFWRTGGEGRYQETAVYFDFLWPYAYLPWNYKVSQVYVTPDGGLAPTLLWLDYREGRDDYLYVHTLEKLAKEARAGSPARTAAEAFLAELKGKIHFDGRRYHLGHFDGVEGTMAVKTDEWNATSLERYRWHIAMLIKDLAEEAE